LLDENCKWLKPYLKKLNFTALFTLEDLGLPKNATDDEIVKKMIDSYSPQKDKSAFLLLTNNEKDFEKRMFPRFDVLVVPNSGGISLAENIKSFIKFVPKEPKGTLRRMVKNQSFHNSGYDVHDVRVDWIQGKPSNTLRRKKKNNPVKR
jgi:hypothetical protein